MRGAILSWIFGFLVGVGVCCFSIGLWHHFEGTWSDATVGIIPLIFGGGLTLIALFIKA